MNNENFVYFESRNLDPRYDNYKSKDKLGVFMENEKFNSVLKDVLNVFMTTWNVVFIV